MKTHTVLNNFQAFLILLFCSIFVFLLANFRNLVIDDAFITFQYAKNFAEHFKPWYNLEHVEQGNGQTSILWMAVLALLKFFGMKPENSFYILNIFLGFFLITDWIKRLSTIKKNLAAVIFTALSGLFFTWWLSLNAAHGLETVLAATVLYLFINNWDKTNFYAVLLPLIRPELALFLLFWVLDTNFFKKTFFERLFAALIGIVIFTIYTFSFYDYLLPLPFVYKSTSGIYDIAGFKVFAGYLVLFSPVIFSLFLQKRILLLLPLVALLFYYTFHINSYSSGIFLRYLFPLSVYFMFCDFNLFKEKKIILFILFGISLLRMADLSKDFYQSKKMIVNDNMGFEGSYGKLNKKLTNKDRILIMDAGNTAYFSEATSFDGLGLNDATLLKARKENDCTRYREYISNNRLNIITIGSQSEKKLIPRMEAERFISTCLQLSEKKPSEIYPMDKGYFLFVYKTEN